MQRQAILERIGWRFIRIRGSQFFKNPDETMQNVITQLNDLKIYPEDENKIEETRTSELLEKVKLESNKYLEDIQNGKEIEVDYKDILYALDTNKHLKNNTSTHNTINTGDVIWGPSQFRYMVLYSEGINRKDISEYFKFVSFPENTSSAFFSILYLNLFFSSSSISSQSLKSVLIRINGYVP